MPDYTNDINKLKEAQKIAGKTSVVGKSTMQNLLGEAVVKLQQQQQSEKYESLATKQYEEYTNPNSAYYQTFAKNLQRQLASSLEKSSPTTQNLLALTLASGASYGTASKIANEQRKAIEAQNRDVISRTTSQATGDLFVNMAGQANQALGMGIGVNQFQQNLAMQYAQLAEQRRQYEQSRPGFFDFLGGIASFGLGKLAPGLFGRNSSMGQMTSGSGFDINSVGNFTMPKIGLRS